jgi:hypothetical protein
MKGTTNMKHQLSVTVRIRQLHDPKVGTAFLPPVIVEAEKSHQVLAMVESLFHEFERYDASQEAYIPPADEDGETATRALSDRVVETIDQRASMPIAIMACLDAAVRVIKTSGLNDLAAIETLEYTLRQVREAIEKDLTK